MHSNSDILCTFVPVLYISINESCRNLVLIMMRLRKQMTYIIMLLLTLVLAGCGDKGMISSVDDLNGSHIAVLDKSVIDEDLKKIIPNSEIVQFKSASEFLVALAIGKCEAGVVKKMWESIS